MKFKIFAFLWLFTQGSTVAQGNFMDSLKQLLKKAKQDSVILRLNYQMSNECQENEIPIYANKTIMLAQKLLKNTSLTIAQKKIYKIQLAGGYNDIAFYFRLKGNSDTALYLYQQSLDLSKECKDSAGIVLGMNNLGSVYYKMGQVQKAISYYNESIRILQRIHDPDNLAATLCNLALICNDQHQHENTMRYFRQSLNICNHTNNNRQKVKVLQQMAGIFFHKDQLDSAELYYNECIQLHEQIQDFEGESNALYGLGKIAYRKKDLKKALEYFTRSIQLCEKLGDKFGAASTNLALSEVFFDEKLLTKARYYADQSLKLSEEIGYPKEIALASKQLFEIYKEMRMPEKALPMYELFVRMRDSINNIETRNASIRSDLKFQYSKKLIEDSLKNEHEKNIRESKIALQNAELSEQRTQKYALIIGIFMVTAFVIYFYNRYKFAQIQKNTIEKQKKISDEQKEEIEYKNSLITQSIDYAKRIQDAFIQSETILNKNYLDYFLFNKPKDIVSGDFLWVNKNENSIWFAIVDCTGHGVPGAILSIVVYNLLEQISVVNKSVSTSEFLTLLFQELKKSIRPQQNNPSYDGMEITLCKLNQDALSLEFSGTKQRFIHLRNNISTTYRTNSSSVNYEATPEFQTRKIDLQTNDILYFFTDGYADQLGGKLGQKLNYENFEKIIANPTEFTKKKEELDLHVKNWMKVEEQCDDMLVFGLKI